MKCLAIIPARGGSKRIPGKNKKNFCGKPIMEYSIQAALESGVFDEVMVSTDDKTIAEIAVNAGASVPFFRSAKTSDDFSTTADVTMEVLHNYSKMGKEFDAFCCLYPTAPFVTGDILRGAKEVLSEDEAYEVMSVVRYSYPIQRALKRDGKYITRTWPEYTNARSQDLEVMYHDCGQFYFYSTEQFIQSKGTITEKIVSYELEESRVQDIDTLEDWKMAELKYQILTQGTLKED